ncbi:hypothetical protein [Pyxidicoccus xibeiensis]|uniref:hypothetical protein n=1 Tax=Pyxidicoccus xibeiensis TaxID=2906759 RepID=UPI0020A7F961|nr:hypothetical protein [Pyxidicoccus xibeiensis]MCP3136651.1 hypothetical protein [Pyxidicoccus xibeiensis]
MALDGSIAELFAQLEHFRQFPKYSLERRVDVFLALFIEEFLSEQCNAPVRIIAPEFPLKKEFGNQSTNVDYLLRRDGPSPAWLLLELKTSADSFCDQQLRTYLEARAVGMEALLGRIRTIQEATNHREKYEHLLQAVAREVPVEVECEVVYLAPVFPRSLSEHVRVFTLDAFAAWRPTKRHLELWPHVRQLLQSLHR